MDDVFDRYIDQEFSSVEGDRGVRNLEKMLEAMGYGQGFMRNRSLEEFLSDNSGAITALLEWIGNEVDGVPEWREGLESELFEDEEDEEWTADNADFNDPGSRHHY